VGSGQGGVDEGGGGHGCHPGVTSWRLREGLSRLRSDLLGAVNWQIKRNCHIVCLNIRGQNTKRILIVPKR